MILECLALVPLAGYYFEMLVLNLQGDFKSKGKEKKNKNLVSDLQNSVGFSPEIYIF